MILISNQEPPFYHRAFPLSKSSSVPEKYGVDFLFSTPRGLAGIQRKQFPEDFLSSLRGEDQRLARECNMMERLVHRMLILEGRGLWSPDGRLIWNGGAFTRREDTRDTIRSVLWSMKGVHDIWTEWVDGPNEMIQAILDWQKWMNSDHIGVGNHRREQPKCSRTNPWDQRPWILMGVHQLGYDRAMNVLAVEEEPLVWRPGFRLESVRGIGWGLADGFRAALRKPEVL